MSQQIDRYISFKGIEWERKTKAVIAKLQVHMDQANSPFWPYFQRQRSWAHNQGMDDLRVLHNFLPTLREILEDIKDFETLSLLEELEETCM